MLDNSLGVVSIAVMLLLCEEVDTFVLKIKEWKVWWIRKMVTQSLKGRKYFDTHSNKNTCNYLTKPKDEENGKEHFYSRCLFI